MLAAGRAFGRGTHFVKSIGSGFAQEDGQRKDGVIALAGKRRVSRSNVFDYYKRELKGIGVKNASDFVAILKRREKRLSRVKIEP